MSIEERRLIIHGTWFGLARQTELTKLARVKIDMPNGLDSAWKIDVKKASAHLHIRSESDFAESLRGSAPAQSGSIRVEDGS